MLLAIDAGNTNTVFSVFDDAGSKRGEWRSATTTSRTADEYGVWLIQLMALEGLQPGDITSAIIATVVPSSLHDLKTLCHRYFDCPPLVVGEPNVDLGVPVKVDNAAEVGADRLVNTAAGFDRYGGPLIIVDFGTATTFDLVDGEGAYAGGVIAPGVNLSLEALHRAAAKLPLIGVTRPKSVIGRNTRDAMASGVYWGYVSVIEGITRRIQDEAAIQARVIATGGLAKLFVEATEAIETVDPDLTLRGLLLIHGRNSG